MRLAVRGIGMVAIGTIAILAAEVIVGWDQGLTGYLLAGWLGISLYFGVIRPDLRENP